MADGVSLSLSLSRVSEPASALPLPAFPRVWLRTRGRGSQRG